MIEDLVTPGTVGAGDRLKITFDAPVDATVADPALLFSFPVAGDGLGTGASFVGSATGVLVLEIDLGAGANLTPGGSFDPGSVAPGDQERE